MLTQEESFVWKKKKTRGGGAEGRE